MEDNRAAQISVPPTVPPPSPRPLPFPEWERIEEPTPSLPKDEGPLRVRPSRATQDSGPRLLLLCHSERSEESRFRSFRRPVSQGELLTRWTLVSHPELKDRSKLRSDRYSFRLTLRKDRPQILSGARTNSARSRRERARVTIGAREENQVTGRPDACRTFDTNKQAND